MNDDTFLTIQSPSEASLTEKRSKFLAFAFPIDTPEEAKQLLASHRNTYYDARHVCYAYRLGASGEQTRASDDGEPSGTAGKPILGQLLSAGVTNVLVIVVRYFGGILLGTGGLAVAYRQAAAAALAAAVKEERVVSEEVTATFDYPFLNDVMRIAKDLQADLTAPSYGLNCRVTLCVRRSAMPLLRRRLLLVKSVVVLP